MPRLPSGPGERWVLTMYGYVVMMFDECRDVHDLFLVTGIFASNPLPSLVGWITEELLHRADRTPRSVRDLVEDVVRKHLREKERMASGEHRREDQEGKEGDAGADAPRAEKGDDPAAGADEEAREGPREDLEPAVAGWRGWRVEGLKLRPSAFGGSWHPTDVNRAMCHRSSYDPYGRLSASDFIFHGVPAENCHCGFWVYRTRAYMTKDAPDNLHAFGVVALGGDVVETVHGFRAAEARIVALLDSDAVRELEYLWNSGAQVNADGSGLSIEWRSSSADRVALDRGRFPIPILSELECEMLAIEQGCVFESEPVLTEAPEIGQYLVPSWGKRDHRYRNEGHGQEPAPASIVFAPVDKAPGGALRLDTLAWFNPGDARVGVRVAGSMVDLVWTVVRRPNGPDVGMWCVDGHLNDRDFALQEAREQYGDGWLKRYEIGKG